MRLRGLGIFVTLLWGMTGLDMSRASEADIYRIRSESRKIPGSSVKLVTSEAHFPLSTQKLWDVLRHYEEFSKYIPRVTQCDSIGKVGTKEQVYISVNLPWPFPDLWNVILLSRDDERHRFEWEMMDGNMNGNKGSLEVLDEGEGSAVKMEVQADPGLFLPAWIISWGARNYVPKVLRAIGTRAQEPVMPPGASPPK